MRYAKPFALLALVAPLLAALVPIGVAHALTTSDWAEVAKQIAVLPESCRAGTAFGSQVNPAEAAATALGQGLAAPVNAPKTWKVVEAGIGAGNSPHLRTFLRSRVFMETNGIGHTEYYDPLGILKHALSNMGGLGCTAILAASFTPPQGVGELVTPVQAQVRQVSILQLVDNDGGHAGKLLISIDDITIDLTPLPNHGLRVTEVHAKHDSAHDYPAKDVARPSTDRVISELTWDNRFQVYLNPSDAEAIFDWQIDGGRWHSQDVSTELTPDRREQARALFSRGFDLYKAADLIGAKPLVQAGLKIDPGNPLGWFTLGEISRSEAAQEQTSFYHDARLADSRVYYQHVIDLAPDSVEAIQAKGYLDALR